MNFDLFMCASLCFIKAYASEGVVMNNKVGEADKINEVFLRRFFLKKSGRRVWDEKSQVIAEQSQH
jgi:hypothetical protein